VIIPVLFDAVRPPAGFRQLQTVDLAQWTGSAQHPEFQALLKAARSHVEHASQESPAPALRSADPQPTAPAPTPRPTPDPAPVATAHPAALSAGNLLQRAFDGFARPIVWLAIAAAVLGLGLVTGFARGAVAAALEAGAGLTAQACVNVGVGPLGRTFALALPIIVGLIVLGGTHSVGGLVTAILVASAIFIFDGLGVLFFSAVTRRRTHPTPH
jgi:hypothetical protein